MDYYSNLQAAAIILATVLSLMSLDFVGPLFSRLRKVLYK